MESETEKMNESFKKKRESARENEGELDKIGEGSRFVKIWRKYQGKKGLILAATVKSMNNCYNSAFPQYEPHFAMYNFLERSLLFFQLFRTIICSTQIPGKYIDI